MRSRFIQKSELFHFQSIRISLLATINKPQICQVNKMKKINKTEIELDLFANISEKGKLKQKIIDQL